MSTRIPTLLEPYLTLPPETSLILLTSILGASTNWLVSRYLHTLLTPSRSSTGFPAEDDDVGVVLLSFLRDYSFWRDAVGRLGTDLESAGRKGRFRFVDGLTELFAPHGNGGQGGVAGGAGAGREGWSVSLRSGRPEDVRRVVSEGLDQVRNVGGKDGGERKVVLVVDQLDLLLAAGEGEGMGVVLGDMVADWREKSYATIMTLAADESLVAHQETTLEKNHAALVLSVAHEAELVLGLRLLDTGTAKDVSGVVRITRGGAESSRTLEEKEYLYFVGGDGGVRVFERGQ